MSRVMCNQVRYVFSLLKISVLAGCILPVALAHAKCSGAAVTVFISSVVGSDQLSDLRRFPHLLATGNIGLYLVDGATRRLLNWPDDNPAWVKPIGYDGPTSMKAMIAAWGRRAGGGIFEGGESRVLTPSVPVSDYKGFPDSETGAMLQWFAAGWHPHIVMLNLSYNDHAPSFGGNYHNPSSEFTERDVRDTAIALRDVRKVTKAELVLPYISNAPQGHVSDSSDVDIHGNPGLGSRIQSDYATDPFYANSRRIALEAGGLGIDTPANIFSTNHYYDHVHSEMFRRLIVSEIRWANAHHLVTAVFMTIFDVQHGKAGNGPDARFLEGVQREVRYLKSAKSLPTYWIVGQYSNGPANTNMPATDTTPESISQVATWVASNAPTLPSSRPELTCSR